MKYRITEFNDARRNSRVFAVETGKRVWSHWFWYKTVWQWVIEKGSEEATQYETFEDAMQAITELKKQEPIIYNVK